MYSVDELDEVRKIDEVPPSSAGAPLPMIVCDEHQLHLAYLIETGLSWNNESCALIRFSQPYAHFFGPPNDEAFVGHPLAQRGLHPYGCFEVLQSSWIRGLEQMNSVHRFHKAEHFAVLRHFIFAFHDSTFECIARDFEWSYHIGSVVNVLRSSFPYS